MSMADSIAFSLSALLSPTCIAPATTPSNRCRRLDRADRIREIGIRMALGADGRDVMRLVLRQALWPVAIGGVVGIIVCAAVSQVLSDVLYGIGVHDPIAFIGVPFFLLATAFLASYAPARRASRLDPMEALRHE